MTQVERDLILAVAGECPEAFPLLYQLARHKRQMEILEYLVRNKITGKTFVGEITITFKGSILNFMAWVIKKIDKDVVKRPILVGRDWD